MKRLVCATSNTAKVKLEVEYEPYERYTRVAPRRAKVSGTDLLDALKKMTDKMSLYLDSQIIDEDGLTAEQVLEKIDRSNGDGCDFIYYIKNLTTGEVLLSSDEGYGEDEDWDE